MRARENIFSWNSKTDFWGICARLKRKMEQELPQNIEQIHTKTSWNRLNSWNEEKKFHVLDIQDDIIIVELKAKIKIVARTKYTYRTCIKENHRADFQLFWQQYTGLWCEVWCHINLNCMSFKIPNPETGSSTSVKWLKVSRKCEIGPSKCIWSV